MKKWFNNLETSTKVGLAWFVLGVVIIISLVCVTTRDKNLIKELTKEDCDYIFFHGQGRDVRLYKTTSGDYYIVSGLFWTNVFKQTP